MFVIAARSLVAIKGCLFPAIKKHVMECSFSFLCLSFGGVVLIGHVLGNQNSEVGNWVRVLG